MQPSEFFEHRKKRYDHLASVIWSKKWRAYFVLFNKTKHMRLP